LLNNEGDINLNIFGFLMGGLGAYLAMKFGGVIGINDVPNHRSSHGRIIPKGGGVGILFVLISTSLVLSMPENLWLSSLVISLVGFWGGDKHLLSAKGRLVIQFGCSVFFLVFLLYSKQVAPNTYFLIVPISVFIVGTSNFYNFMDGIDGIAGITGFVGFSMLSFYNHIPGTENAYPALCLALAFSCLGFLCFNIPKAKVFIGDVGSTLLGFVFACLVITLSENMINFIVMAGFLAPFYFDELLTMAVRIKDGDSLIIAHRKHIYQLLANEVGISHWKISLVYGFVQTVIGLSIIMIKPMGVYFILLAYLVYSLIFIWFSISLRKRVAVK